MVKKRGNRKQQHLDYAEELQRMRKAQIAHHPQPLHFDTGTYYWVWGMENGRRVLWGPAYSYEEANRVGYSKLTGTFEVVPLRTKNEATASRMLKARVLNETSSADEALKRLRHKI